MATSVQSASFYLKFPIYKPVCDSRAETPGIQVCPSTSFPDLVYCCMLQVIKGLNPHKDFRLWMTAEVHPKFPTILLQSSLKITFEVSAAVIVSTGGVMGLAGAAVVSLLIIH